MPHLELNGTPIHYQCLGQGTPVVMVHGLLIGNLASWYFGAASKLARDHEVTVYDLRGHGMSGQPRSGYDLRTMVDDLAGLIDRNAGRETGTEGKVSLVGHSYGGLVALHYALRNPGRVSRLALVEAPLPPSRGAQIDAFLVQSPEEMAAAMPEHLRAIVFSQKRQSEKFIQRLRFLLSESDLLEQLKREEDVPDAALARLRVPTLLVYGRQSQLSDVGERLARAIPQSRLEWLEGGHYLPSERPAELGALLEGFLA